jgi:hypothetical protein
LGFVARERYLHKVYPELGDHTNEMAAVDDASLAGPIDNVPPIHRICKYKESRRKCGQAKDFDEPPNAPVPCPNETKKGLAPHDFVW